MPRFIVISNSRTRKENQLITHRFNIVLLQYLSHEVYSVTLFFFKVWPVFLSGPARNPKRQRWGPDRKKEKSKKKKKKKKKTTYLLIHLCEFEAF